MNKNDVFKKYVKVIEIENTSFCNRKCSYCGNYFIDRFTVQHTMQEDVYLKFITNLADIDYEGVINFNRYNEPFADKVILERIKIARTHVKNSTLMCFTNSDYLDRDYMNEILLSGLDILYIQIYQEEPISEKLAIDLLNKKRIELGDFSYQINILDNLIECELKNTNMREIKIQYRDFKKFGNSRGGIIEKYKKETIEGPCYHPVFSLAIDYDGSVMPCCHLRSDFDGHKPYILGNINTSNIIDIYSDKPGKNFRTLLLSGNRPNVCKYCNDSKSDFVREKKNE